MKNWSIISLIVKREYLTRAKKRSYLLMTILGPIIMTLILVVPMGLAMNDKTVDNVSVVDTEGAFFKYTQSHPSTIVYDFLQVDQELVLPIFMDSNSDYLLVISSDSASNISPLLYAKHNDKPLLENAIKGDVLAFANDLAVKPINWKKELLETTLPSKPVALVIGLFAAVLVYFFIFMYAVQVMRSVAEEKTSRIVELILTSVRPSQLMAGKIIAMMLLGLTQIAVWLCLTFGVTTWLYERFDLERFQNHKIEQTLQKLPDTAQTLEMNMLLNGFHEANIPLVLLLFVVYFVGGYCLYGAVFAAIGASVDQESDTQQFVLPVTFPLVICLVLLQWIMQDPNGPLAFWLSMIPFTSPVIMLIRAPYGIPVWEMLLSISILIGTCYLLIQLAGRVYRIGILHTGTTASVKQIMKWMMGK
jgi:ABC-2 type transport system permease protein